MPIDIQKLFFLGRPLGPIYGFAMQVRQVLYRHSILPRKRLAVPVISVGNLVLGGTGKTPVVKHLAQLLQNNGYSPAIISRGYRGTAKHSVNIVSNGEKLLLSPLEGGDEPTMLAQSLPNIPVLTGKRRAIPALYAVEQYNTHSIVLDDGFQHLGIERDIDIVLFDATTLAGNSRIFPGGPLREPVSALKRCHCFLITGINEDNRKRAELFTDLLQQRFPEKPVFHLKTNGLSIQGKTVSNNFLDNYEPAFAFCGIANPQRFLVSLEKQGVNIGGFHALSDHVRYTEKLLSQLCQKAKESGSRSLITTEKDGVKLVEIDLSLPLFIARLENSIPPEFDQFIISTLQKL